MPLLPSPLAAFGAPTAATRYAYKPTISTHPSKGMGFLLGGVGVWAEVASAPVWPGRSCYLLPEVGGVPHSPAARTLGHTRPQRSPGPAHFRPCGPPILPHAAPPGPFQRPAPFPNKKTALILGIPQLIFIFASPFENRIVGSKGSFGEVPEWPKGPVC